MSVDCAPYSPARLFSVKVSKSKVLLVEDSKFLRVATERALSNAGFEVSTAEDGEKALRMANAGLPDIILLDLMLPKISGPDVLKALKESSATRDIPVIVLSSLSQKNEEKLLSEGAAAYFEKSTLELDKSSDRLAAAVETVLGHVQDQKDLDLRLQETAEERAAADASTTETWEIEIVAVKSSPCTTTIPRPPLKN